MLTGIRGLNKRCNKCKSVGDAKDRFEAISRGKKKGGTGRREIRMFIWSRNFQSRVTMNILMTSCGCSRLGASCKVGIRGAARGCMEGKNGRVESGGWKGAEKNRLQQKGSPRSLLSLEIIIVPLTVARLVRFSVSLFPVSSTFRSPSLSPSLSPFYRSLISFYGNCVYETTRELQVFVIP